MRGDISTQKLIVISINKRDFKPSFYFDKFHLVRSFSSIVFVTRRKLVKIKMNIPSS